MRLHRNFLIALAIAALVGAGACSNNTQGDDASPVFYKVDFTLLPLDWNVNSNAFLQFTTVTLTNVIKVPSTGTTQFLDARLDSYTVEWSRIDGGKTASAPETFAGNVVVPAGSQSTLTNYPFMSPVRLNQPPLDQLFPYNGGIDRETGATIIRQAGKVTFNGHTLSGQPVSGFGTFDMAFFYAATTGARPQALRTASPVPALALQRMGR